MAATPITRQDLIDFVVQESRLLDAKRYEEWNALFTDDAFYWVPAVPEQEDGINHCSHMYEDKLLRELRIERLKSPRPTGTWCARSSTTRSRRATSCSSTWATSCIT